MTNNPTIDGVSRAKIHHLKIHAKPFEDLVSGRKTSEVRNCADREFREGDHVELFLIDETGNPANRSIVRTITHIQRGYGLPDDICVLSYALLDAPAVERQPIKNASEVAYNLQAENAALQSTIADMRKLLATRVESSRLDEATDTIAQLQARIAELESGRGDVIAEVEIEFDNAPAHVHLLQYVPDGTKLYASPPASAARLWEIRIPEEPENPESPAEYFYAQNAANRDLLLLRNGATVVAEYACLDATAALNGPVK